MRSVIAAQAKVTALWRTLLLVGGVVSSSRMSQGLHLHSVAGGDERYSLAPPADAIHQQHGLKACRASAEGARGRAPGDALHPWVSHSRRYQAERRVR
jgi:hypothetical protein